MTKSKLWIRLWIQHTHMQIRKTRTENHNRAHLVTNDYWCGQACSLNFWRFKIPKLDGHFELTDIITTSVNESHDISIIYFIDFCTQHRIYNIGYFKRKYRRNNQKMKWTHRQIQVEDFPKSFVWSLVRSSPPNFGLSPSDLWEIILLRVCRTELLTTRQKYIIDEIWGPN